MGDRSDLDGRVGNGRSGHGCNSVARDAAQKSHRRSPNRLTEIASTLKLAIQHEQDLIVSAAGFVVENPNAYREGLRRVGPTR